MFGERKNLILQNVKMSFFSFVFQFRMQIVGVRYALSCFPSFTRLIYVKLHRMFDMPDKVNGTAILIWNKKSARDTYN